MTTGLNRKGLPRPLRAPLPDRADALLGRVADRDAKDVGVAEGHWSTLRALVVRCRTPSTRGCVRQLRRLLLNGQPLGSSPWLLAPARTWPARLGRNIAVVSLGSGGGLHLCPTQTPRNHNRLVSLAPTAGRDTLAGLSGISPVWVDGITEVIVVDPADAAVEGVA